MADDDNNVSFAEDEVAPDDEPAATVVVSHTDLFAAVEESISSCRPLVNFFFLCHSSSSSTATSSTNEGNINQCQASTTRKQRRTAILSIVKSKSFNKSRARRLFSGLVPLLQTIVEEERYLPDSDEDEDNENGQLVQDDLDNNVDCIQSIFFLRCCAYLVEGYLEGMLNRIGGNGTSRRNTANTTKNGGGGEKKRRVEIIDEAFEVAEMLHDLLFPLQSCATTTTIMDSEEGEEGSDGVAKTTTTSSSSSNSIHKEAQQTQSAIFTMCETYWHGNFDDKEQMVTQLIPLLLVKSLDESAQKTDVKRLYSIREAINLLDFRDTSIDSLKLHLLRTVGNPLFVQSVDGRKFITHLFTVDATLVGELHRAVRAQIPGAKKSILNAYGEIYYNAWRVSTELSARDDDEEGGAAGEEEESIQTSIEENALQDFMYQVIHSAVPSTSKSVRVILDKFYLNKKNPLVENMLHRLYGPLLWRALSGANSRVRLQASVVLSDTFPLRDPEAGNEWTEQIVKKSVEALVSLMTDDVPVVRVAGCKATAKILSGFWVAVPSKDIRVLLNHIIAKHASDASSAAVRAAAVDAVTTLLEEDKTHAVLRPLLPSVGNLIHDKIEKVRLAVVNMLLCIKKIRGMKYYHVVPANHLLARLGDEGRGRNNPIGPVAKGLSNLLSNSFFPTGSKKTMTDIINRTLRLLTDNPGAAVNFYKNASSQLSVNSISKLIAALMKCLCYYIIEEKRKNCEDISNLSLVVEEDEPIECRGHSNTALMATISESISILWEQIEADLKDGQNETAEEMLIGVFSGNILTEVYCHFEAKVEQGSDDDNEEGNAKMADCRRACDAILNCAGMLDESKIEGLRPYIVEELSKASEMSVERRMKSNLSPNVALLCAWGMTEEVAECLASSISDYFTGDIDDLSVSFTRKSNAARKRNTRSKKKAATDEALPKMDIDVCLGVLGHLLKGADASSLSTREAILTSDTAFQALVAALEQAKIATEQMLKSKRSGNFEQDANVVRRIRCSIESYARLLFHKNAMQGSMPIVLTSELKGLVAWAADTIAPSLMKIAGKDNTLRDLDLSSIMSVGSPIASPMSGCPPSRKMTRNSSPILGNASFVSGRGSNVIDSESKFSCTGAAALTVISTVLWTFAEWITVRYIGDSFGSNQITKLYKLLESSDSFVRTALLQPLFRIAITSLNNEGDASFFKEVLLRLKDVDSSPSEKKIIGDAMSTITSIRNDRILKAAIASTIVVTRNIVQEVDEEASEVDVDVPTLDKVGVFMKLVLSKVLREKQSSLVLAQCLVGEPKGSPVRECLFKELEEWAPKSETLRSILGKWVSEKVHVSKEETVAGNDVDKENVDANQMQDDPLAA